MGGENGEWRRPKNWRSQSESLGPTTSDQPAGIGKLRRHPVPVLLALASVGLCAKANASELAASRSPAVRS